MREGQQRQRRWALAGTIVTVGAALIAIVVWHLVAANVVEVGDDRARQTIHAILRRWG